MNDLTFCFSKNVFLSYSKDIFDEYKILAQSLFYFNSLVMSFYGILASIILLSQFYGFLFEDNYFLEF